MSRPSPLRRLWRLADPDRARVALAVALATLSLACGVGLLAVSAWLISRASEQPPILYLQVAIVSVRAFGIFPEFRVFEDLVQFCEFFSFASVVKDTSAAVPHDHSDRRCDWRRR